VDHEANRQRLRDYEAKSGHKVVYNDGGVGVAQDNHMSRYSPNNHDEDRLNRAAAKRAAQDDMRQPDKSRYNEGPYHYRLKSDRA
jgi:hypothetical protein